MSNPNVIYTADGRFVQELDQINDDGSSTRTYFNVAGSPYAGSGFVEATNFFDADGAVNRSTGLLNNGNSYDIRYGANFRPLTYTYIDSNEDEAYSTITYTYNGAGNAVNDVLYVFDNGDTQEVRLDENGRVQSVVLTDESNTVEFRSRTDLYSADGSAVIERDFVLDDGSSTRTYFNVAGSPYAGSGFVEATNFFDADGAVNRSTGLLNNGNSYDIRYGANFRPLTYTYIDSNEDEAYSTITYTYNGAGNAVNDVLYVFDNGDTQEVRLDENGRVQSVVLTDESNTVEFRSRTDLYSADGSAVIERDFVLDDGSSTRTYFNVAGSPYAGSGFVEATNFFDADGAVNRSTGLLNNGNSYDIRYGANFRPLTYTYIDSNEDEAYSTITYTYNGAGNAVNDVLYVFDNGDTQEVRLDENGRVQSVVLTDESNTVEFRSRTDLYSADGSAVIERDFVLDDGSSTRTYFNVAGSPYAGSGFVEATNFFDADGAVNRSTGLLNNGNSYDIRYGANFRPLTYTYIDSNEDEAYSTITYTYNGAGNAVNDVLYVFDNGDTQEVRLDENGRVQSVVLTDESNTVEFRSRTDLYSADGSAVIERDFVLDDGSSTRTYFNVAGSPYAGSGFVEATNFFDADGAVNRSTGRLNNGNSYDIRYGANFRPLTYTYIDSNEDEAYSTITYTYNGAGNAVNDVLYVFDNGDTQEVRLDENGRVQSVVLTDESNTVEFRSRTDLYSADGSAVIERDFVLDDGSSTRTYFNVAGSPYAGSGFVEATNFFDADGAVNRSTGLLNNGNSYDIRYGANFRPLTYTYIDSNEDEAYSTITYTYNGAGNAVNDVLYVFDNGDTQEVRLDENGRVQSVVLTDESNTVEFRSRTDLYSADGSAVIERDFVLDDGSSTRTYFNVAGSPYAADWFIEYTYSYAADGFLSEWTGLRTNGNRWEHIFNRDGSKVLSEIDSDNDEWYQSFSYYYDANNVFYRLTGIRDDGDSWDYSYADNGARYTSTTEIDSNNSDAWTKRTSFYTADGQRVQQLVQLNDDGTREETNFEINGQWAGYSDYTNYFDPQNQIVRQTGLLDDGNRWDFQWDNGYGNGGASSYGYSDANNDEWYQSVRYYYDANGQFNRYTGVRDDGDSWDYSYVADNSYRYISTSEIDSNNSDAWTKRTSFYTADGKRVQQLVQLNDDGTSSRTLYNVAGSAYSGDWFVDYTYSYAADGFLNEWSGLRANGNRWDYTFNRDGSFVTTEIDANNDEWYQSYTNTYDASGQRITQQTGTLDNGDTWQWIWDNGYGNAGTSERIDWDTSGTKPWWHQVADYNAANQLSRFETYYDDNTKVIDNFSNDANAGWTKRTDLYSAAGALTSQTYT